MTDEEPIFVFDENWSHKLIRASAALLQAVHRPVKLQHLFDFFPSGASDDDWVPAFQPLKAIIITADRARRYGGPKLPWLLRSHGITHVLIGKKILHLKGIDKAICILRSISLLESLHTAKAGTCHRWRYTNDVPTMEAE
jgi:hypothetical protein